MPYTVPVSFDKFFENINLSGDHRETSNTRKDDVVAKLKRKFDVIDSFATGSIPKYTAVTGYADLDIFAVLHWSKHTKDKTPSEVLQDVRDALAEYHTSVRKNGQAVTLYYKSWPNVDIVPVTRHDNNDKTVNYYEVPDMNREEWIKSRPRKHSTNIDERAKVCGDKFRKLIKMVKWWNHQHGEYLQSYHIEVLALRIFTTSIDEYTWPLYDFFKEAAKLVAEVCAVWYEDAYPDTYLTYKTRPEAVKRLETARDRANQAWYQTYGDRDNHEESIRLWRIIFGDQFPAYRT